jgi:hypothetical protein
MAIKFGSLLATIAAGASLSDVVTLSKSNVIAIQIPAVWTSASITFSVSADGVTYSDLRDQAGNEFTIPAVAGKYFGGLDVRVMGSFNYMRIRSGTSASPVNQTSGAVLNCVLQNAIN